MKLTTLLLSCALPATLLLAACRPITPEAAPTVEHAAGGAAHAVHWGYEGAGGPAHWGDLDPAYAACATGTAQSPIDIAAVEAEELANVEIHYLPSPLTIFNNGHTVEVSYAPGSTIAVDGQTYELKQFHYHAPSEHAVDGTLFAAELHLVHKTDAGDAAVIGVLLQEGAENAAYQPFVGNLPAKQGPEQEIAAEVDAAALLPAVQTTYRYGGSLTTPPCTEGVRWLVMTTPVQLSAGQIAALQAVFDGNNRPLQALGGRVVVEDSTP